MSRRVVAEQNWALDYVALQDAYTDFILSRQAMLCSPATVKWYSWTLNKFLAFTSTSGVTQPAELSARHIRQYLSDLAGKGLSDSYIHSHARAIRTLVRFLHSENYIPTAINFQMPGVAQKRLHALSTEDVKVVLAACEAPRDQALVMLMVDTGVRRAELIALNWGDVDLQTGLIRITRGKGGKARSIVVGVKTRRALLKYRRTVPHETQSPLIQTRHGGRFTANGIRSALLHIGALAGVRLSPHALRRTFATLSLKNKMNAIHLQGLMGHSSLEMTRRYIQMLEGDLIEAHRDHGPIDNL